MGFVSDGSNIEKLTQGQPFCAGVVLVRDGKVAVTLNEDGLPHAAPAGMLRIGGVGGGQEPGETLPECALREAKEELGTERVTLKDAGKTFIHDMDTEEIAAIRCSDRIAPFLLQRRTSPNPHRPYKPGLPTGPYMDRISITACIWGRRRRSGSTARTTLREFCSFRKNGGARWRRSMRRSAGCWMREPNCLPKIRSPAALRFGFPRTSRCESRSGCLPPAGSPVPRPHAEVCTRHRSRYSHLTFSLCRDLTLIPGVSHTIRHQSYNGGYREDEPKKRGRTFPERREAAWLKVAVGLHGKRVSCCTSKSSAGRCRS